MKKFYIAPALECLAYCADTQIGASILPETNDSDPSFPWNNGELGWT